MTNVYKPPTQGKIQLTNKEEFPSLHNHYDKNPEKKCVNFLEAITTINDTPIPEEETYSPDWVIMKKWDPKLRIQFREWKELKQQELEKNQHKLIEKGINEMTNKWIMQKNKYLETYGMDTFYFKTHLFEYENKNEDDIDNTDEEMDDENEDDCE